MTTPDQERTPGLPIHDGDYVEIVRNHVQDDPYIGKRGYVLGHPWSKDAPKDLPIALMLEEDPAFGPTFFHPDELKVIIPGSASRAYAEALASREAEAKRLRGTLEQIKIQARVMRHTDEQFSSGLTSAGEDVEAALTPTQATTPVESPRLLWMALRADTYYPGTASPNPKAAALDAFEGWGDDEPVTVAEFKVSDVTDILPDDLFDGFLEDLADSLIESYTEDSAEREMLDSLYGNGSGKAPDEVNALLRPAFEAWWRKHAAGFGVDACYTATGQEQTFAPEELKTQVTP